MEVERTDLEYREGTSDKVYIAIINKYDDGHQVEFRYGRRWQTHNRITKPTTPVSYPEARAIYDEMINKKLKKGYVPMS